MCLRNLLAATEALKVFVGIGNVLRHDDGVGVYICSRIRENQYARVINAEVSIENYIGKINSISADVIILIDSIHMGQKPGNCRLFTPEKLADCTTNTHNISFGMISDFFASEILILGIQPATVSFGEGLSSAVQKKADRIISAINAEYSCF